MCASSTVPMKWQPPTAAQDAPSATDELQHGPRMNVDGTDQTATDEHGLTRIKTPDPLSSLSRPANEHQVFVIDPSGVHESEVLRLANQDTWTVLSHVPVNFRVTDEPVYHVFNLSGFSMKQDAVTLPYFFA